MYACQALRDQTKDASKRKQLTLVAHQRTGPEDSSLTVLLSEDEAVVVAFRRYTLCRSKIDPMRSFGEMTGAPDITTQIEAVVAGFLAGFSDGRPKELPQ